ncbi:ABC transporter permease [Undibacterium sp. SXout7W]|uniref:ABC transporter permease n=1 Tax=Undibacterium sp. SXout7W TaxID=3413049 RepID=UPI003BF071E6
MSLPSGLSDQQSDLALMHRLRLPVAIIFALAVGFVVTAIFSKEPVRAFIILITGALPDIQWSETSGWHIMRVVRFCSALEDAITLTFLGLAIAIPFRARQFSLGADGQMFLSALMATVVSLYLPGPGFLVLPAAFCAAIFTGFLWGLLPGLLKARYQANEIVTTLMLNLIAIQFFRFVIAVYLRDPNAGFLASAVIPTATILPSLIPQTNLSAMIFMVPVVAAAAWWWLNRTTPGYEIRTVGEAPDFAKQAGMPVHRAIILSMATGGIFAAFAGIHISNALLKRLPVDMAPGLGFDGLVVALLARNDPKNIPLSAFFYAYLRTGAQAMERGSDVSREIVMLIQAFMILFIVADRLLPIAFPQLIRSTLFRFGKLRGVKQ